MIHKTYTIGTGILSRSIATQILVGNTPDPEPEPDNTPNGLGESIDVSNLDAIWFKGTANNLVVDVPTGYSCNWKIYDSKTLADVQSGSGNYITYTPTSLAWRDVEVKITRGTELVHYRWLRTPIKPLPPLFTRDQADRKIDLVEGGTGFIDLNNVDMPGHKIYVSVTDAGKVWNGSFQPFQFYSSDPENPITVIFEPGITIKAKKAYPYAFSGSELKNVVFHGLSDPGTPYGVKWMLSSDTTTGGQIFYCRGIEDSNVAGSRTAVGMGSKGLTFAGFEFDGRNGTGTLVASSCTWQAQNAANDNFNYGNYSMDGINVFKWYVHHTLDEGLYVGRTGDSDNYAGLKNVRITECLIADTGNDSAQFGNCENLEVYQCQFIRGGTRNNASQRNGLVINPGCKNWSVYQCLIEDAPELMQTQTGVKGTGGEVFANIFINRRTSPASNIFSRVSKASLAGALYNDIRLSFFNNTIITPASATNPTFSVYYNTGITPTRLYPYIAANNLIVSATATQYNVQNVTSQDGFTVANYVVNNMSAPLFVNANTNDFHLSSKNSPAFGDNPVPSKVHFMGAYDYDGCKYNTPVRGAFSAQELFT